MNFDSGLETFALVSVCRITCRIDDRDIKVISYFIFGSYVAQAFLTLVYLQTKGKRENGSLLLRNLRFAKIRHIGDYFADSSCKIRDGFTDFGVGSCHHFMPWSELCFALSLI